MRLDSKFVPVSCSAKYLGIYFDSCFTWNSHLAYLEAKTTPKLSILSAMAGSIWGVNINDLRHTYIFPAPPQFLYCVLVWFVSSEGHGFKVKEDRTLALIRRIQARVEKIISGTFGLSAGAALDIELFLRSFNLQLAIFLHDVLLRIVTGPTYKYITKCRKHLLNLATQALPQRKHSSILRVWAPFTNWRYVSRLYITTTSKP